MNSIDNKNKTKQKLTSITTIQPELTQSLQNRARKVKINYMITKDQNFVSRGRFGWLGNGNVSKYFENVSECFGNISKVINNKIQSLV